MFSGPYISLWIVLHILHKHSHGIKNKLNRIWWPGSKFNVYVTFSQYDIYFEGNSLDLLQMSPWNKW